MTHVSTASPQRSRLFALGAVVGMTALAIGVGLAALREPRAAVVLFPALVALPAMLRWPESATPVCCFVLYTNATAVAVQFHGVPYIIAAALPALLLLPLAARLQRGEKLVAAPGLVPLLVLLALYFAGSTLSEYPGDSLRASFDLAVEGVVIFVLITNVVRDTVTLRRVTWAIVAAGFILGAAPVYQQLTGNFQNDLGGFGQLSSRPFFESGQRGVGVGQYRLAGAIGEQNRFAQVLLVLFPLGAYLVATSRTRSRRVGALVFLGTIGAGAALAFSRGAAVGFVALVLAAVALRAMRLRGLIGLAVAVTACLIVVPGYRSRLSTIPSATSLLSSEPEQRTDGAMRGRATVMLAAALVYADYPVFGVGPGAFRHYSRDYGNTVGLRELREDRRAHSLYLELAAELGTAGLICFGAILFAIFRELLRTRRRLATDDPDGAGLATAYLLALVAYLATAMFLHLAYARYFWLLVGLAAAASRLEARAREPIAELRSAGGERPVG